MPAVPATPLPLASQAALEPESAAPDMVAQQRAWPGPLVLRMVLVAVLALGVGGVVTGWWLARASVQGQLQRLQEQQNDEVEVFARLLAGKIEQSQRVLRSVADGITPGMLDLTASLEWQLQQGLAAAQFFDALFVARSDGAVRVHQKNGRFERAAVADAAVRAALNSTLSGGKPLVVELLDGGAHDARILLTMPLHRDDGSLLGVVAGSMRLQSPGFLSASLALPQRNETRLLVYARDGTILAHSNPVRVMGRAQDEPALADVLAQGLAQNRDGAGATQVLPQAMVSMAGVPLAQWTVARVSDTQALLSPVQGVLRSAWLQALGLLGLLGLLLAGALLWLAYPLAQLRQRALQWVASGQSGGGVLTGTEVVTMAQALDGLQAERARQQAQVQALQAQWDALLAHAPWGVALTRGASIVSAGQQLGASLGYAARELQGQPVDLLYTTPLRQGLAAGPSLPGAGVVRVDEMLCLRRKDGSQVWMQAKGRPVREGDPSAGMLWLVQDASTLRNERSDPAWVRTHDVLTGLENRFALEQRLQALASAAAGQADQADKTAWAAPVAVLLFLDLDYFTVINDAAGHAVGDEVLCAVARLLQDQVQGAGWVARLGGDEFTVLLPATSESHASGVAQGLCSTLKAWEPTVRGRGFSLGASIGLVVLPGGCTDAPGVLHAADMACYDAKRAGRNCVRRRAVPRQPAPVLDV